MSFSVHDTDHDTDTDTEVSHDTSHGASSAYERSTGDVWDDMRDVWKGVQQYLPVKYDPVYAIKLKNSFRGQKLCGKQLPALTCSASYTKTLRRDYLAAVVKPTHDKWARKLKVFPDRKEARLYATLWSNWGYALKINLGVGLSKGLRLTGLQYSLSRNEVDSKLHIPSSPSLLQFRPSYRLKTDLGSAHGELNNREAETHATSPYIYTNVTKMKMYVMPGQPINWRSTWPPTKWFKTNTHDYKKEQWEQSLEHDNQKHLFVQSLRPEDQQAYYRCHPHDFD